MRRTFSSFSGACIRGRNIPETESDSPSARRLSSTMAAESGSNPIPVMDPPSSSHSRSKQYLRKETLRAMRAPEILMVDDNPADIDLTSEVLDQSKQHFHVNAVTDGAEAISFLHHAGKYAEAPSPDLVILDLNL